MTDLNEAIESKVREIVAEQLAEALDLRQRLNGRPEIAEYCGVSTRTVQRWIAEREASRCPIRGDGRLVWSTKGEMDEWQR